MAALFVALPSSLASVSVEKWGRFEYSCEASVKGNPFDVKFSAVFSNGSEKAEVRGFYDGDGVFRVRFMPRTEGEWTFVTRSNVAALRGRKGSFTCVPASGDNHGPVRVMEDNAHGFSYADGLAFHPLGTTAYSWMHQSSERQEQTLASLEAARDAVHAKAADLEKFDKQVVEAQKAFGDERTRADAFGNLLLSRQSAVRALAAVRDSLVSGMWIESWEPGQVTIRYWKDRVKAASGKTPAESFVEKLKSKGNVEPTSVKIDKMSPIGEANSLCEQFTVKVSFK